MFTLFKNKPKNRLVEKLSINRQSVCIYEPSCSYSKWEESPYVDICGERLDIDSIVDLILLTVRCSKENKPITITSSLLAIHLVQLGFWDGSHPSYRMGKNFPIVSDFIMLYVQKLIDLGVWDRMFSERIGPYRFHHTDPSSQRLKSSVAGAIMENEMIHGQRKPHQPKTSIRKGYVNISAERAQEYLDSYIRRHLSRNPRLAMKLRKYSLRNKFIKLTNSEEINIAEVAYSYARHLRENYFIPNKNLTAIALAEILHYVDPERNLDELIDMVMSQVHDE